MKKLDNNQIHNSKVPEDIQLPIESLVNGANNFWLLKKRLGNKYGINQLPTKIKIPIDNLEDFLKNLGITFINLVDTVYNNGLAVDIVSYTCDPSKIGENPIISEMLRPIILYNGQVVLRGQVILSPSNKDNIGRK